MLEYVNIEINNPYPKYSELFIHELDDYPIDIHFSKDNQPFDVVIEGQDANYEVSAAITINDIIVTDNPSIVATDDDKGIRIWLTSSQSYSIFPGLMKVEIELKQLGSYPNNKVIYPIIPLVVNVKPSILDNAAVIPESEGTVADLVRLYPDLVSLVENPVGTTKLAGGAVTKPKLNSSVYESTITSGSDKLIESGAVYNALSGKLNFGGGTFSTAVTKSELDQSSLTNDTIYKYRLAADFLYAGSPAMNAYVIQPDSGTRLFITFDEGLYIEKFGTSSWYDCEPCVPNSIEARLSALESANTILENAINEVV